MTPSMLIVANVIRYVICASFLWFLVAPEIGRWTFVWICLISVSVEYFHGAQMGWWAYGKLGSRRVKIP